MFESAPQQKVAVAYTLVRPSGEFVNLVLIFQVKTKKQTEILYVDHEVTQMCTSGNANVLIVGTVVGSLTLFDLSKHHGNTSINSTLNYTALLEVSVKDFTTMDPARQEGYLAQCRQKYFVLSPCYFCDGLPKYPHYVPIKKLMFITRDEHKIAKIGCLDENGIISVWNVFDA